MFSKWLSSNNATIGSQSNGNLIMQNSKINNVFMCSQSADLIEALGAVEDFAAIQKIAQETMSAINRTHPLSGFFSAKYDNHLERLISTPETAEALEKYPKRIECSVRLDSKKYPYMDKSETPWEYAYRTQTPVEMETTAYQEYLGEIADPFPVSEYSDGMVTTIVPPPFPPAVSVSLVSEDVSIPIMLQRKPCMTFGQIVFETTSVEWGFSFRLTLFASPRRTNLNLTTIPRSSLSAQLLREKLLCAIKRSRRLSVMHDETSIASAEFKEEDLSTEMFRNAPYLVQYLTNLRTVEERLGCAFDMTDTTPITPTVYRTAMILASSLNGHWHCDEMDFDNDVRCDYDHLPTDIENVANSATDKFVEGEVPCIRLQGLFFRADKYTLVYRDACINNIKSVEKNRKRRRKNILLTFKPLAGKTRFQKFCLFEGIEVLPSS